ncbi:DUF302 domain-containing protein [Enterococcus faecium]|uniref:DUF302 domain-containing protein n=1 Tax=Enterococcus faecium TaxID=1352 RepID=UPI0021AE9AA8|nr:DUF302 domain-containing protein [Enterococcus faecium]MDB7503003.1 DUF302 domain-containing protein [Enterococcus faecium]MDB7508081.1 DUF302 domain-containing protein [Enterococcus faecium]MEB4607509.1 DUF302 domain-containing protein [Enterococcus sp. E4-185]
MCNPKQAKEVLEKRIEVGYFLPCKVVVYEKEADVYIGLLKPTVLPVVLVNFFLEENV